jgi:hypothetical protein
MGTLLTLKENVGKELGFYFSGTTSAAGEANGSTVVCRDLARYEDGSLIGKWIELTSGSTLEIRQIANNYSTEGILTFQKNFTAAIAISVTFDIYDFNPDDIKDALNRIINDSYPDIARKIVDTTLIGGNVLPNASFEDWASTSYPDYWRTSVSTLTEETTIKLVDGSAIKAVNAGYAYLSSDNFPALRDLGGQTVDFYCWAYAAVAATCYLEIYTKEQDGTTTTTTCTTAHTGGSEWELLSLESTSIPDDLAEIQFRLKVVGANTAYFDNAFVSGGTVTSYVLPLQIDRVIEAYSCNDWEEFDVTDQSRIGFRQFEKDGVKYIRFGDESAEYKIELHGYAPFSELSTNSTTHTFNIKQQKAITFGACAQLLRSKGAFISSKDESPALKNAMMYEEKYEIAKMMARSNKGTYRILPLGG